MQANYYVATDARGIERYGDTEVAWKLPHGGSTETVAALHRPDGELITLRQPIALLDTLDEIISLAEPAGDEDPASAVDGLLAVRSARLVTRTPWDAPRAALFAIDCATHALGDAADVELPGGHRMDVVLADARRCVAESSGAAEHHLGLLARLATARRLRREERAITGVAFGLSIEDIERSLDTTLDPAWSTAASVADALFAALEALRHVAAPRYVGAREQLAAEQGVKGAHAMTPIAFPTPFGPILFGAEHDSPYMGSSIAAREAALRARETLHSRGGEPAEQAERAWQAERLTAALAE